MKLILTQPFTLEIGDTEEVISGTLKPLTKKEQKEFEKTFDKHQKEAKALQRKSIQINRLTKSIESLEKKDIDAEEKREELYRLEDELNKEGEKLMELDTNEVTAKKRIEMSIECDNFARLTELCEIVGYRVILDTIIEDIEEKKGNDKPAS
jgi:Skp family chaperone for outer membrane proteins